MNASKIGLSGLLALAYLGCLEVPGTPCTHDADCPAQGRCEVKVGRCFENGGTDAGPADGGDAGFVDAGQMDAGPDVGGDGGVGDGGVGDGGVGDGGAEVTVEVMPSQMMLKEGNQTRFNVLLAGIPDRRVTWLVLEGSDGGMISSDGVYTAPFSAGTFHVVAQSVADPSASGQAEVEVVPP